MRLYLLVAAAIVLACGCGSVKGGRGGDDEVCWDFDGDGHGRGCEAGPDCDDWDPDHFSNCDDCAAMHEEGCACEADESYGCYDGHPATLGVGVCEGGTRRCVEGQLGECEGQVLPEMREECGDGDDDNCNGETDEEWQCAECTPPCVTDGEQVPSPDDPGSSGLVENPDGPGVVLGHSEDEAGYAWIANSDEGTTSKLDISSGMEVGRYAVGLTGSATDSPSRTAVDDHQNAYVANRAFDGQGSVTKIASADRYCMDRDSDGEVDSSSGPAPLALGEDECVLWTASVGGANAIPRALVIDYGTVDIVAGFPWVGCYNEQRFYRLDPADGEVTGQVDIDVTPYGAAIDGTGWIWVSGRGSYAIQRFHYMSREVEEAIPVPEDVCGGTDPYGITVDLENRVWIGVWDAGGACRYDPATGDWLFVDTGGRARGVAVDGDGYVWASNDDEGTLYRFLAEDGTDLDSWIVPGVTPIGVGVDRYGRIWTINHDSNDAARFDLEREEYDVFPVGLAPYTYSDFLGFQRWLVMPRGIWVRLFDRCDETEHDRWLDLVWDTETPGDSYIIIVGRSATTPAGVLSASEVTIARIGPEDPDVGAENLEIVFDSVGVDLEPYLEVTVYMMPGTLHPVSPVFRSMQVFAECSDLI